MLDSRKPLRPLSRRWQINLARRNRASGGASLALPKPFDCAKIRLTAVAGGAPKKDREGLKCR